MILTGKAKEDFIKWCIQSDFSIITHEDIFLFALIIEWLDSVGIYIEPFYEFDGFGFIIHKGDYKKPLESIGSWKTRQEAIKQSIIKANEIYNGNNSSKQIS